MKNLCRCCGENEYNLIVTTAIVLSSATFKVYGPPKLETLASKLSFPICKYDFISNLQLHYNYMYYMQLQKASAII